MAITPQKLKEMYLKYPEKTAHAMAETLRQFGYERLQDQEVQEYCDSILNNEDPKTDVVYMFLQDWFEKGID